MKAIQRLKKLEILMNNFCLCLVETLGAMQAPRRNVHLVIIFSEIMN